MRATTPMWSASAAWRARTTGKPSFVLRRETTCSELRIGTPAYSSVVQYVTNAECTARTAAKRYQSTTISVKYLGGAESPVISRRSYPSSIFLRSPVPGDFMPDAVPPPRLLTTVDSAPGQQPATPLLP